MYVCIHGHHIQQEKDQTGEVANPARDRLNRENEYFPVRVRAISIIDPPLGGSMRVASND